MNSIDTPSAARRTPRIGTRLAACVLGAIVACGSIAPPALARGEPEPRVPLPTRDKTGRVVQTDEPTVLAFKNVSVEQVLPFIVETTGKVVIPGSADLFARKITIINDQPIKRSRALDLVFFALHQNGISVVETPELVILRDIAELAKQDVPVLGPDTSVLEREDLGTIVEKVFSLQHATAETLAQAIEDSKSMPDYAKMIVDTESNQIAVMGNIALLQRIETLVKSLDVAGAAALSTRTYRLRYADAEKIAQNIRDLFSQSDTRTGGGQQNQNVPNFFRGNQQDQGGRRRNAQQQQNEDAALSRNLRVTANTQQNSVTVLAEKQILTQVGEAIDKEWDLPLDPDMIVSRVYELKNSDPIKVRNALETLFGKGAPATASTTNTGGGNRGGGGGPGGGGSSNTPDSGQGAPRLAGTFSFEALPEQGRLIVIGKSKDNIDALDRIISELDQPLTAGLPRLIELKHASAEELAEQLNALLAQEGTLAQIPRQETGLTEGSSSTSPFAQQQSSSTTTDNQGNQNTTTTSANNISFWWQRARPPTDSAGASNLVSKVRIVPVWRQNALMIMSPPEYQASLVNLVETLDQPGRQVLVAAVIAEISLDDALALGLRWSSQTITPTNPDNAVSITSGSATQNTFQGTKNNLIPSLFDTSVLNVGVNLNVILQALSQKTGVNILSEPRIFTSDNQEAEFFDGQDIPFITDSQTGTNNNLIQSFDYRAVGLQLRVRPRITIRKDVDLRINLELSSIVPGQTLFGGFIVDRRETTTHLIVKDGQTVVISGILRREDSEVRRKVPLLGDIPIIGGIFRSKESTRVNTELVAFITPIVLENTDAADKVYEQDRERLEQLRGEFREPAHKPAKPLPPAEPTLPPPPPESAPPPSDQGSR